MMPEITLFIVSVTTHNMRKYEVRLNFNTFVDITVDAEDEDQAIDAAYAVFNDNSEQYDRQLADNAESDNDADAFEILEIEGC